MLSEWLRIETCGGRAVSFLRVFADLSCSLSRRRRRRVQSRASGALACRDDAKKRPSPSAATVGLRTAPQLRSCHASCRQGVVELPEHCAVKSLSLRWLCTVNEVSVLVKPSPGVAGFSSMLKLSFSQPRRLPRQDGSCLEASRGLGGLASHSCSTAKRADDATPARGSAVVDDSTPWHK